MLQVVFIFSVLTTGFQYNQFPLYTMYFISYMNKNITLTRKPLTLPDCKRGLLLLKMSRFPEEDQCESEATMTPVVQTAEALGGRKTVWKDWAKFPRVSSGSKLTSQCLQIQSLYFYQDRAVLPQLNQIPNTLRFIQQS